MSTEEPTPPPFPYEAPPQATPSNDGMQYVADKIGFVPNLRKSDNIFQLKFISATIVVCVGLAFLLPLGEPRPPVFVPIFIGVLAGLLIGAILSGTILAIKNLKR